MASKVSGVVQNINIGGSNGTSHAIASTAYGYCETEAATAAKVVDMTGFKLNEGITIHVKFKYANTATSPTLNVNGEGAKAIVSYGNVAVGNDAETTGWPADAILTLTYDGTNWVRNQGLNNKIKIVRLNNLNSGA